MNEELKKQNQDLEKEASECDYYILIIIENAYYDQWDYLNGNSIYIPLGYITEEQAKQYENDYRNDHQNDIAYYEEISEREYNLYQCWLNLKTLLESCEKIDKDVFENYDEYIKMLTKQISNIKNELWLHSDNSNVRSLK